MGSFPRSKFFLLSLGFLFLFFIFALYWLLFTPPSQTASTKVIFIKKGSHLKKVSEVLEQEGIIKKPSSPAFINLLGLSPAMGGTGPTLEGFLFPDTYHLFREMDPEEVIQTMVYQFKKVFGPDLVHRASELGFSEREAVILASIIEKETPLPEEKPLISAVFHNRLKKKIPLQSDPTVIYGIKNFNGNLTKEDLMRPTPYNTYLMVGLPPTPICNPGKESLLAAGAPAPVPFLLFASKKDGAHYFSSQIEEQNRAVWKYQKKRSPDFSGNLQKNNLTKKSALIYL